jgi:hypothetical protein
VTDSTAGVQNTIPELDSIPGFFAPRVGRRGVFRPPSVVERRVQALRNWAERWRSIATATSVTGLVPAFGKSAEGWLGEAIRFCEKAIGSHEKNLR